MYAAGQGVARDLLEAWVWLQRAARAGVPAAEAYIKRVAQRMEPGQLEHAQRYLAELS
jgi:TPR repeat protein